MALAKASWHVLKADKELALLPIISGIASLIVAASFIVPMFFVGGAGTQTTDPSNTQIAIVFVMYLVLAYITIFFNAALVFGANQRLEGGDPTLRSALGGALSRAGAILPWALVSATVSLILRAIEERVGVIGRIVVGLIGLAWTLVTFLVVPLIVIEGVGVTDAVKGSAEMFKRTWGENVIANVGFGLIGFLAMLPAFALAWFAISVTSGVLFGVAVVWMLLVGIVVATLTGIYQTALYRYARHGSAGAGFDNAALAGAFRPRHR